MKQLIFGVALASAASLFAAEPGGYPGFLKAVFTGSACDTTSDVFTSATSWVAMPEEMYASDLAQKTTVAYGAYMYMEEGVQYDFKGCYDDFVTVKIGSTWVLSQGDESQECTGSYTPTATDWYKINLRVANNGGDGGVRTSSQYGILWKTSNESTWRKFAGDSKWFRTGTISADVKFGQQHSAPVVLSAKMRESDPTVMDIEYIVASKYDTVDVRALAFQDGERSFWKVVRATTFVKDLDGNETACNIGDDIVANVPHKLAWKVATDWKTDLAKVKFEVICSDAAQLPLKLQTIPATAKNPAMTIGYNSQTDADIFNALLWYYAKGDEHFANTNGYVDVTGIELIDSSQTRWVNRTSIVGERMDILKWFYAQMGYEPLIGGNLMNYVRTATRKNLWWNTSTQNCYIKSDTKPKSLYVGEKAYCVIDVSGGADAESYPVTYLDTEPVDGWSDEYKTTKILLRRCEAGKYLMQNSKEVTLTKPFYMGVFMITKQQYAPGTVGSCYSNEMMHPVVADWIEARSFMDRIQAKTGLNFDLPTEAQWEYACRAGTSSDYCNGGSDPNDCRLVCHSFSLASCDVGLSTPNFWGIYGMHGNNMGQWCLDYFGDIDNDPAIDYQGPDSGSARVYRGGNYRDFSWELLLPTSFVRYGLALDSSHHWPNVAYSNDISFRLSLTLSE